MTKHPVYIDTINWIEVYYTTVFAKIKTEKSKVVFWRRQWNYDIIHQTNTPKQSLLSYSTVYTIIFKMQTFPNTRIIIHIIL